MSGKNCKLCGVSDESFGCYETCTFNGPQHEWATFDDLRRELAGVRSQTSTFPDNHTRDGKRCDGCGMPDSSGTLWVIDRVDDAFELFCGSCLRSERDRLLRTVDRKDEQMAELQEALSRLSTVTFDAIETLRQDGSYHEAAELLRSRAVAALDAPGDNLDSHSKESK